MGDFSRNDQKWIEETINRAVASALAKQRLNAETPTLRRAVQPPTPAASESRQALNDAVTLVVMLSGNVGVAVMASVDAAQTRDPFSVAVAAATVVAGGYLWRVTRNAIDVWQDLTVINDPVWFEDDTAGGAGVSAENNDPILPNPNPANPNRNAGTVDVLGVKLPTVKFRAWVDRLAAGNRGATWDETRAVLRVAQYTVGELLDRMRDRGWVADSRLTDFGLQQLQQIRSTT